MTALKKVTAFITHPGPDGPNLLLFQHPSAGIQFPAGTVEAGETPEAAGLREAGEESGLEELRLITSLGWRDETPVIGDHFIATGTTVYSRPDPASFDWARLRVGVTVQALRHEAGYIQVTFEEPDRWPDPQYPTYAITGWVPEAVLAKTARRYFYLLAFDGVSPTRWTVNIDNHIFAPFWAPLDQLPEIIAPQRPWLEILLAHLRKKDSG